MLRGRRTGLFPAVLAMALAAAPFVAPGQAAAQNGSVAASVTVLLPPSMGTGLRGLDFGVVTPGTPTEVLPTAPVAGWFQLDNIARNQNARLTFTLPVALTPSGGGAGMPVYFNGPYARSCGNGCQTHTLAPTPINASQVTAEAVHVRVGPPWGANPRTIDVYLGGRVEPAPAQPGGVYQGTVQLTFAVL